MDPKGWAANPALANAGKFYGEGTIQRAVQMLREADKAYVKHSNQWDEIVEATIVRDAKRGTLDFDQLYVHMTRKIKENFGIVFGIKLKIQDKRENCKLP